MRNNIQEDFQITENIHGIFILSKWNKIYSIIDYISIHRQTEFTPPFLLCIKTLWQTI